MYDQIEWRRDQLEHLTQGEEDIPVQIRREVAKMYVQDLTELIRVCKTQHATIDSLVAKIRS